MTKLEIEEDCEGQKNFVGFEDGKVSTFSGVSFSGYGHKFSEANTKKLYKAMKRYYENEN